MSLETRLNLLADQLGDDMNLRIAAIGILANLTTTNKNSLVEAINEVAAASPSGALLAANDLSDVNDTAAALANLGGLTQAEVDARVQLVVDAAPAALDTLNEIAAALGDDANFSATITAALGERVRFDAAQTKTAGEQLQACQNIGVGDPEQDLLNVYTTARDA